MWRQMRWPALMALCILALCVDPAQGCRYNVREVGFIDLGIDPYRLIVYPPQTTAPDEVRNLQDKLDASLVDTNIRAEIVAAGADANHPDRRFLSPQQIDGFPAAVLVSPDGQSRRLALPSGGESVRD